MNEIVFHKDDSDRLLVTVGGFSATPEQIDLLLQALNHDLKKEIAGSMPFSFWTE